VSDSEHLRHKAGDFWQIKYAVEHRPDAFFCVGIRHSAAILYPIWRGPPKRQTRCGEGEGAQTASLRRVVYPPFTAQ